MYKSLFKCNVTIQEMLKNRGYDKQIDSGLDPNVIDLEKIVTDYKLFESTIVDLCKNLGKSY